MDLFFGILRPGIKIPDYKINRANGSLKIPLGMKNIVATDFNPLKEMIRFMDFFFGILRPGIKIPDYKINRANGSLKIPLGMKKNNVATDFNPLKDMIDVKN